MDYSLENEATLTVILARFSHQRLPRILALKQQLGRGERLGDFDLYYLERTLRDINHMQRLVLSSPRHQVIFTRAISLYSEVIARALENER